MENQMRKRFIRYVSANIWGMLGLSCYILADTYFIAAKLGAEGLTALNLAIPAYSVMNGVGLMIGVGAATRFAILRSRHAEKEANQIFTTAFLLALLFSLVFFAAGMLGSDWLAGMLGASAGIRPMTAVYMRTMYWFAPLFLMNNLLIAFIRNDGRPSRAMAGMLSGSFFNIVMDYVMLFPLDLGMFGAAFATCMSPAVSLIVMSPHFWNKQNTFHFAGWNGLGAIRLRDLGSIFGLGMASLINEVSSAVVLIVFNLLILQMEGDIGVAAYGVVANLALVAVALFTGIAQGSQPLFSEAYGKGNRIEQKQLLHDSILCAMGIGGLLTAGAWLFTAPLVGLFNQQGDLRLAVMAEQGLRLYFPGFLCAGLNIVTASYFSATEQPGASLFVALLRGFFCILLFAVLLSSFLGMKGIWLSFGAAETVTLCAAVMLMRRKRGMEV
ncbi:MAG: MATE family efflux transporter [Lachnospiraceae bacterium]|nr:MATE family efflux transporter [Lachnospiraceae bacterium]